MSRIIQIRSHSKSKNLKISIGLPDKQGIPTKLATEKAICFYRDLLGTLAKNDADYSTGSKAQYLRISFADDFEIEEEDLVEDMQDEDLFEEEDFFENNNSDYNDEWYDK